MSRRSHGARRGAKERSAGAAVWRRSALQSRRASVFRDGGAEPRRMSEKIEDVARFYAALRRPEEGIGGTRRLSRCDGCAGWPERGVCFFFEGGEGRTGSGAGPRVIHVGTHALRSGSGAGLWNRLRNHRGTAKTGGGNHRGSIFRRLVGAALAAREPGPGVDTWGCRSSVPREVRAREAALERRVSDVIGKMPLLWLGIKACAGASRETPLLCSVMTGGPGSTRRLKGGLGGIACARKSAARVCGTDSTSMTNTIRGSCRRSRG